MLGLEGQKSRLCPLPIPCCPPQDQGQRLVILHKVQASVRSGLFKADSSHTAPEVRGGSAWQLLLYFSPSDVTGLPLLKTCDREAWTDGPTETLMLSQAPSAHCRDAGKMGQLGFRAKRQGGVWGDGTRDWQVAWNRKVWKLCHNCLVVWATVS